MPESGEIGSVTVTVEHRHTSPGGAALAVVALGVAHNLVVNLVLPDWAAVPAAAVTVIAALVLARRVGGLAWPELGLARDSVGSGLRWGGAAMGAVAAVYLVGLALPATRDLFRDERVADMSTARVLLSALVIVPFGTVLGEEIIFRGVVLGLGRRLWSTALAVAFSSLLFGLWHVAPAWDVYRVNPTVESVSAWLPGAQLVTIGGAVLGTALAGVVFCWLRLRSGSLLAPAMLHFATNSFGYLAAWAVLRAG